MVKKVLVLHGSPRRNGNTALLSEAFSKVVLEAGHEVRKIFIRDKNIQGCLGCGACRRNGGSVFGLSANRPKDTAETAAEQKAYELGKRI